MKKFDNKLFIPPEAPFSEDQRAWISGFTAGLKAKSELEKKPSEGDDEKVQKKFLNILYGTQTGNAESIAESISIAANDNGLATKILELNDIEMKDFKVMDNVVVIISTYGEGEMPDNAQLFWDSLSSDSAPNLSNMQFGILALGDTGYDEFCNAGKLIDKRLEKLGAKRILERVDCDVDFEDLAEKWTDSILPLISPPNKVDIIEMKANRGEVDLSKKLDNQEKKIIWSKKNPYMAEVSKNILLSGKNSKKEIRHYEIDLGESNLNYKVGDSLNVIPINDSHLVELIINRLDSDKDSIPSGYDKNIFYLLQNQLEISTPNKKLIKYIEKIAKNNDLSFALADNDKKKLEDFLWEKDILDLLNLNLNYKYNTEEFLNLLRPLQHRAYSISSSPNVHKKQVHLTIASVRWNYKDRAHKGVCSTFMADRMILGTKVGVFLTANNSFRIPDNDDAPIIMVGPGTGLAPFRAFLEERDIRGSKGKNWLFFGDQTKEDDFIYKDEILKMKDSGLISKLDLAFSRDTDKKIYVQSKMYESGAKIFKWLEEGSYFYVCGDASRMAKDVESTLVHIIKEQLNSSEEKANEYLNNLKREKRYLRDVY